MQKNDIEVNLIDNNSNNRNSILRKTLSDNYLLKLENDKYEKKITKNKIYLGKNKSVYKSIINNKNCIYKIKSNQNINFNDSKKIIYKVENWKKYNTPIENKRCCIKCIIF